MNIVNHFISSLYQLSLEMAPYLLFGFLIAGILKIFLPKELLYRHLTKNNFGSVLKASLLGVPLPICSCGVIPVAAHLKKEGARNGPILSFLTSTPTSGVDSIIATYSLLGPLFAFTRALSALVLGIISGTISNLFDKEAVAVRPLVKSSKEKRTLQQKVRDIFSYAFIELIADIAKWLMIGIIAGALLEVFVPKEFVANYLNNPFITYLLMMLIGVPLYVCATGSIPIAATFLGLGISPGATLVFLLVGPATNTATIAFVAGKMGKKPLLIYLTTIISASLLIGIGFDSFVASAANNRQLFKASMEMIPLWISHASTILLYILIAWTFIKRIKKPLVHTGTPYFIPKMTCHNCVSKIEKELINNARIKDFGISLKHKKVFLKTDYSDKEVADFFESIDYPAKRA